MERISVIIETYIPAKSVTVMGDKYNGNDRSVPEQGEENPGGEYKSFQLVTIETDPSRNGGSPVYGVTPDNATGIVRDTGISYKLDKDDNPVGSPKQADGKTLGGEVTRKDDGTVNIHVHGNEANPLVSGSPGITYNYDIKVTQDKDGKVSVGVTGTHDRFPAHVISASRPEKPGSKNTVVYSFNPDKAGTGVYSLSPLVRAQKKVDQKPVELP